MASLDLNEAHARYLKEPTEENLASLMQSGEALVKSLAYSISPNSSFDDLMQAGYIGLMQAVNRFDPKKGAAFATYAYHWVMGEIRLEVRRERTFDRPLWMVRLQDDILKATDAFMKKHMRVPNTKELAELLNMEETGIAEAMQAGHVPLEDLELERLRSLTARSFQLPIEDRIMLQQALAKLNKKQKVVFDALFNRDMTQEAAAEDLGLSRSQVHRTLKSGLAVLKNVLS